MKLGIYKHFKGGLYEVITIGKLTDDPKVELVVYKQLYHSDYPKGTVWIRNREDFEGFKDGIKRFKFLGDLGDIT